MKILLVKLSSLGDVVHSMPAVQDILRAHPDAQVDWVVERGFAPLVRRCKGVRRTVECEIRRWRKSPLAASTRGEWAAFRGVLQSESYDAIIDLQGLTKSALVSRVARTSPGGRRYAMANRTEGSSYESPTRWAADVALEIEPRIHAVARAREMCARALGYEVQGRAEYGFTVEGGGARTDAIVFVHGTSRDDKCWPEANWIALAERLAESGHTIALPHGSDAELARSERMASAIGSRAQVWPRLPLDALLDRMAACAGCVGVDSGLSHIAVALDLPHVQIYNFDTAWRTGPEGGAQASVFARPTPSLESVLDAWRQVTMGR